MTSLIQLGRSELSGVPQSGLLLDSYGRLHSDLRISVTDRCNIRCFYCMPEEGAQFAPRLSLLSFDEIERFIRAALPLGITKIRLTGGEPLLRPRLAELIARLSGTALRDLALTTNGVLLAVHARTLFDAGLRRLNVHLDTLDRERFRTITRRDDLGRVMAGIEAAQKLGFQIKLNAVAVKGLSEPDIPALVRFGRENDIEVRFIEFMPLDAQELWGLDRVLTADAMIASIEREFGPLTPVPDADPRAPATEYRFADGSRVGFIASVSKPFCGNCNRLRLTSDGKMRNCLFARDEVDAKPLLKSDALRDQLQTAIRETVWSKWIGHDIQRSSFVAPTRPMYSIGG
ncbi:MAG: GTP 3',8-cyclase MoaA [Bryobacteraceae bacterium]